MRRYLVPIFFAAMACTVTSTDAQGTKADYERARTYRDRMSGKVFRDRVEPNWINDGPDFWYRVQTGKNKHEYVVVHPAAGQRQLAFDHQLVADALSDEQSRKVAPDNLPIRDLEFSEQAIDFDAFGERWRYQTDDKSLNRLSSPGGNSTSSKSTAKVLQRMRPSGGSGNDTNIRFVNETKQTLKLYWYNSERRRVAYGTIERGTERDQHTFVGHTWLITDEKDQPLAGFEAVAGDCVAYIEASSSVELPKRGRRRERNQRQENQTDEQARWQASIRDFNLWLHDRDTGTEVALSSTGSESDAFEGPFEFSPDGRWLVAMQTIAGETRTVYHIESAPDDRLQPVLHDMEYAKPGDKLPVRRPRLFDLKSQKQVEITNAELYANAWSINRVRWSPDSSRFHFVYNARGHQALRIISVDPLDGVASAVVDEQSKTFVDYAGKQFSHFVDDTGEIVWMSERDGWNHLYLFDGESATPKNQITFGEWVVRRVERVDDEERQIWFQASGVFADQDPYYIHLGRVDFDGSNLVWITRANGTHR